MQQPHQIARRGVYASLLQFGQRPPAQLEHELGVELFPTELWLRIKAGRNVYFVDLFALAIELAAHERHDVQSVPEVCADHWVMQSNLFGEFSTQRIVMSFACIESAAGQGPTCGRRKLETNKQHSAFAVDHKPAHCLADSQRADVVRVAGGADVVGVAHSKIAVATPDALYTGPWASMRYLATFAPVMPCAPSSVRMSM